MGKIIELYFFLIEKIYRCKIRKKNKNTDFTIISNDCWGGRVYLDLGIEYNSPTVNLFFYSNCYIKLISNLKYYLDSELSFKEESFYNIANEKRKLDGHYYPIGLLKDIEIHFLHSANEDDARLKWNKRKKRVNYENIFFKFSDAYLCDEEDLKKFESLNFNKKICFTAKEYPKIKSIVWIKDFEENGNVLDPFEFRWKYRKYFDVIKWLNY